MSHTQKGFTLIETIIVLVLLGILAAVAVPKYYDLQERAYIQAARGVMAETQARVNGLFAQLLLAGKFPTEEDVYVSTLNTPTSMVAGSFTYGIADGTVGEGGHGTGRISGWKVEMMSNTAGRITFCAKNGNTKFKIKSMVSPSGMAIHIWGAPDGTYTNSIHLDAEEKELFYIYTPSCD